MTEGMKKLLIPVAVILVCAIILTAASAGLAGTAASNAETELNEMISYLLPGGGEFEEIEYNGADSKITNVYKGEGGYVLAMTTNGYVDEIKLLVAVDNDGVVKGYTCLLYTSHMPASRTIAASSAGVMPLCGARGCIAGSGVSLPSLSMTTQTDFLPPGIGSCSTAATVPDTEACTGEQTPSPSPIF